MGISYSQYIDYLFMRAEGSGTPLSGTFELTARCNLDCKMCYIHRRADDAAAKKQELSAKTWLTFAADAQKQGMLLLLLTGGEPLLRPDFREIYTGCRKLGILVSINTNATLMTEDMVDFLRNDPPIRVNVTLYGASPETYAALCGDGSAYDRAYRGVRLLQEAGIRVKLNYSVTPQNIQDAEKVYAFAAEHELLIQPATYMFPPVRICERGGCPTARRLTPTEAAGARWDYDRMKYDAETLTHRAEAMLRGQKIETDTECQELPTERIRCRAGSTTFWVTYNGQMRPCGMMQTPSFDALPDGFAAAWERTRRAREEIWLPAKCTACSHKEICEFCPAVCYAETGDYTGVPTYICEKTEAYLQLCRDYLAEKQNGGAT